MAGSTLIAYALFQPMLRRVRRDVDRRFDRARYDADGTVGAFAERLRQETDIEAVTDRPGDDHPARGRPVVDGALAPVARHGSMTVAGDGAVDAIVVGAGPNGLAAAITLARAGRSVRVYEAAPEVGGGTRTMELTLPGFRHDMCSTILPLTLGSPFFRGVDLASRGVEIVHPDVPVAHPLDGGRAAVLDRSVAVTAEGLGGEDGRAWRRLFGRLVRDVDKLGSEILRPVVHVPRHPLAMARFGLPASRVGRGAGPAPLPGRAGEGAVRRDLGALDAQPRSPVECLVRAGARDLRARGRLADGPRRGVGRGGRRLSRSSRRPAARS